MLSRVCLFVTPWTVSLQALLSVGFSRQDYWSGLPFPSLEDLPDTGIECVSPDLAGRVFTTVPPRKHYKAGCTFPFEDGTQSFPPLLAREKRLIVECGESVPK